MKPVFSRDVLFMYFFYEFLVFDAFQVCSNYLCHFYVDILNLIVFYTILEYKILI